MYVRMIIRYVGNLTTSFHVYGAYERSKCVVETQNRCVQTEGRVEMYRITERRKLF
jgi:hypothetical protein